MTGPLYLLATLYASNSATARDLGYVFGQILFYLLLAVGLIALVVWLWRRRG